MLRFIRAVSSAVRASRLHREGPRFKSVTAHHPPPEQIDRSGFVKADPQMLGQRSVRNGKRRIDFPGGSDPDVSCGGPQRHGAGARDRDGNPQSPRVIRVAKNTGRQPGLRTWIAGALEEVRAFVAQNFSVAHSAFERLITVSMLCYS